MKRLSLISALLLTSAAIFAADLTWDGSEDANWSTDNAGSTNWSTNTVPAAGDNLIFSGNVNTGTNNDGAAGTAFGNITFSNNGTAPEDGSFTLSGNSIGLTGNITTTDVVAGNLSDTISLDIQLSNDSTITTGANHSLTISGVISEDASSRGLIKAGSGTLILSGTNTFTGKTTINGGTLQISSSANLGTAPASYVADQLTIDGGTLEISPIPGSTTILSANQGLTLGAGGATINTTVGTTGQTITFASIITGTGDLTLDGHGSLAGGPNGSIFLSNGSNDFIGNITINSGLLRVNDENAFGNAANDIIFNGTGGLVFTTSRTLSDSRDLIITNGAEAGLRVFNNRLVTIDADISGTGSVRFTDGGELTLAGNNSFSGDLIAGTNSGGNPDILHLAGNFTYGGNTIINGTTTIQLEASDRIPDSSQVQLNNAAAILNLNGFSDTVASITTTGNGATITNGGATPSNLTVTGIMDINGSNTNLSGNLTVDVGGTFTAFNLDNNGEGDVVLVLQGIDNRLNSTLTNSGNGTLGFHFKDFGVNFADSTQILGTANTYEGGVIIDNALVTVRADGSLGATSSNVTLRNGGVLQNNTLDITYDAARTIILEDGGGAFRVGWAKLGTFDSQITGSGNIRIVNDSGIALFTNTSNDYSGDTIIGGAAAVGGTGGDGRLRLGASGVLPDTTDLFIVDGGSLLDLNGFDETIASLTASADGSNIQNTGAAANLTITGNATFSGSTNITGNTTLDIAGRTTLTGSKTLNNNGTGNATVIVRGGASSLPGTITDSGTGTLALTFKDGGITNDSTVITVLGTNNTFEGGLTVDNSKVRIQNEGSVGNGNITLLNGGLFQNNNSSPSLPANQTIILGGGDGGFRVGWTARTFTLNGNVTGTGNLRVVNDTATNPLVLTSSSNDYSGNTIIGGGTAKGGFRNNTGATLRVGANEVIPNGAGKGIVEFDAVSGVGTLDLGGFDETINGLVVTSGTAVVQSSSGSSTLTVGDGNTSSAFSGTIQDGAGTVAVTKIGDGTLNLSGTNTYSGNTNVNAGTLIIDGDQSGATGEVTVASGATLGGTGTIGGNATFQSGSTHTGGSASAAASQNLNGDVSYQTGTSVTWNLIENSASNPGTDFDTFTVAGSIGLGSSGSNDLLFNIVYGDNVDGNNSFWNSQLNEWKIWDGTISDAEFDAAGILIGFDMSGSSGSNLSFLYDSGAFRLDNADRSGAGNGTGIWLIQTSVIPEPGTYGLMALGLSGFAWFVRRRKKKA